MCENITMIIEPHKSCETRAICFATFQCDESLLHCSTLAGPGLPAAKRAERELLEAEDKVRHVCIHIFNTWKDTDVCKCHTFVFFEQCVAFQLYGTRRMTLMIIWWYSNMVLDVIVILFYRYRRKQGNWSAGKKRVKSLGQSDKRPFSGELNVKG